MSKDFAGWDDMTELLPLAAEGDAISQDDELVQAIVDNADPDQLPASSRTLAAALAPTRAPATEAELAGESAAVEQFLAIRSHHRRTPVVRKPFIVKTLVAAGALTLASATAAAATGTLPGAAQDKAADVLNALGIDVPGQNAHSGDHANERGRSTEAPPTTAATEDTEGDEETTTVVPPTTEADEETTTVSPSTTAADESEDNEATTDDAEADQPDADESDAGNGKGAEISSIATDDSLTGHDKGVAVSEAASEGRSHAGDAGGPPSSVPVGPPSSVPVGPPSSLPAGSHGSPPAGPPSSVPVQHGRP